jgi:hypothetical protein
VMLGLETRWKHFREVKRVVLTRQLPGTFAPDIMAVSGQLHRDKELIDAHRQSAQGQVLSWTDSLSLLLHAHRTKPDDCTDPPSGSTEPAVWAGLYLPHMPAAEEEEKWRTDLLLRPRTYLVL